MLHTYIITVIVSFLSFFMGVGRIIKRLKKDGYKLVETEKDEKEELEEAKEDLGKFLEVLLTLVAINCIPVINLVFAVFMTVASEQLYDTVMSNLENRGEFINTKRFDGYKREDFMDDDEKEKVLDPVEEKNEEVIENTIEETGPHNREEMKKMLGAFKNIVEHDKVREEQTEVKEEKNEDIKSPKTLKGE